jgi:hypothetical protein
VTLRYTEDWAHSKNTGQLGWIWRVSSSCNKCRFHIWFLYFIRILPTEHNLAWQEGRNAYATYQGMYEHNLYSLRYLCTFSYSKNNSKFTGSLLKIYICDVNKTLLSMKVKYIYVIQNRKYTGGTVQGKQFLDTIQVISYQFYLYINVISVLCNPNGTLFQTCLILHVWLKSIILVFANILNTFFFFSSKSFY